MIRLTRATAVAAAFSAALLATAPAAAADEALQLYAHVASSTALISTPDRATVTVPVTAQCPVFNEVVSAYVSVSLVQSLGSKSTLGTGTADLVCDGASHDYAVVVPAWGDTGWRQAGATVSLAAQADGYLDPQELCTSHLVDGVVVTECTTWRPHVVLETSEGPLSIELVTPK